MIALDLHTETPKSSTANVLSLAGMEDDSQESSFALLLQGISDEKEGSQKLQKGVLQLLVTQEEPAKEKTNPVLQGSEKEETKEADFLKKLLSLGKEELSAAEKLLESQTDETKKDAGVIERLLESFESSSQNKKSLPSTARNDIKQLISDAKEYLKEQITKSDGYQRAQAKSMPKTLQGLVTLAKKMDVDISKITLQDIRPQQENKGVLQQQEPLPSDMKKVAFSLFNERKNISDMGEKKDAKNLAALLQKQEVPKEQKSDSAVSFETKNVEKIQQKAQPLTQEGKMATEMPKPKVFEKESETKKRTQETKELLIRGEQQRSQDVRGLSADFSVATAKVIAPLAKQNNTDSLESLLNPQSDESVSSVSLKNEAPQQTLKAESLEVKMHEAKQMMKYLSADVKTAIDNYKAPFTRLKVQLNPQNLGEIELTVVQRGKNMHVNLSSNNAAINALAMNANDLKIQLHNSGIQNASLNFSNNSQGGEFAGNAQQQQGGGQRENARHEYNYFQEEESKEEILSSLEIVVPNYA